MGDADSQRDDQIVELLTGAQQQLTRYVRTLVPNRTDADEVLQETNLYIWRNADQFELGTNFTAWVCRIAHYQVLTHRKRQLRSRLHFSDALVEQLAPRAAESAARRGDDVEAFESCVAKLSERDRRLIDLRYEPEATVQSVAERIGRPKKAVYYALGRIRAWLLDCMQRALSERRRG
ncbi:MAG: sigma-70 family RNA polymerase sigma factor [Pirellulales bacterium]|nr:sigma-70 family RNA polymerase sigma factor [Pirellulales bacterium]